MAKAGKKPTGSTRKSAPRAARQRTKTRAGPNTASARAQTVQKPVGGASESSPRKKLPRKSTAQRQRAEAILHDLHEHYADAHCALDYCSPHELLVATILSAQATDVSVNKATPRLFERFPTPADYAADTPEGIQPFITSIGLFRNKSKSIHAAMTLVANEYGGEVPNRMEDLLRLRGVARKTANVVLGNAYGINQGVVVDTHVSRVAKRFGLTRHTDAVRIELDLMALFPVDAWTMLSHMLIFHGRQVCKARGALCRDHPLCISYCANA